MHRFIAKGLRTFVLAVCAVISGASVASAQAPLSAQAAPTAPAVPAVPNLDSVSTEASRYSILSDILWAMGLEDLPERLETAQAAVAAKPDSAEAHLRLGLANRMEHPEAVALARSEYETALRLDPKLLRVYALLGELFSTEGDADSTEQNYRTWLALAPDDPKAHLSYAVALARIDRLPEAKIELERSLALKPTPAAYLSRALASKDGPRDAMLADLDRALALGGGEARIYHWRARQRRDWGETDLALADVAKALEYAPGSFRLRQLRGQLNSDARRYALAVAEFDALIAEQPGWPDLMNDRCWTRAMAGQQLLAALADCNLAVDWQPGRGEPLDSRGLVKLRLGDLPGAIADYDGALKQDPEMATSLFGRGLAKSWGGDKAGAEADLGKARALDPDIDKRFADFGVAP